MTEQIKNIIENLEKRQISAYYAEDKNEAVSVVNSLICDMGKELSKDEKDIKVSWGGSVTLDDLGLRDICRERYYSPDPYKAPDPNEAKREALLSDVFLMSSNAITERGELMNIDGNGNRVAALIYGPRRVIVVVGVNKIVKDTKEALARIKSVTCPLNAKRLLRDTPCAKTGKCGDCKIGGNTMCSHIVTTRFSSVPYRIKVVIVNDSLGY